MWSLDALLNVFITIILSDNNFINAFSYNVIFSKANGFVICSTEGPVVDFRNPINPIEEQKVSTKYYNSEVIFLDSLDCILFMAIFFWK